jgi:hypothetical protein
VAIPRKESPLLFGFITMSSETDRRRTPTQVLLLQGRLEGLWGGLFNELGLRDPRAGSVSRQSFFCLPCGGYREPNAMNENGDEHSLGHNTSIKARQAGTCREKLPDLAASRLL